MPLAVQAQTDPVMPGTRNVTVAGHLALHDAYPAAGHVALDQDLDRPYAYVARRAAPAGFDAVSLADPSQPEVIYAWRIGDPVVHPGPGAQDLKLFKLNERTYLVQAFQFDGGPDADLGAILFEVSGLPDTTSVREVARIQPPGDGGLHTVFAYKHSDGRVLLFAAAGGDALVYDAAHLIAGEEALVARIATPEQLQKGATGYDDVFAAYHVDTAQDRFYGAGAGGYHVFNVTDLDAPEHLTSISSAAVRRGSAISPTPDGRYAVTSVNYRTAPVRIFDLQPALNGDLSLVRTATGAWTANWRNYTPHFEVRWPYVFAAALEDGLHIVNMRDAENPYTTGYYLTYEGAAGSIADAERHGAWDVDVRNADGLIAVTDLDSGLWLFRLEGFQGWDGRGWGLPNVSSVQDWDHGPAGAAAW